MVRRLRVLALLACALLALTACGGGDPEAARPTTSPTSLDRGLRDELLAMAREDQREMRGEAVLDDSGRIARLKEIISVYGWPTFDLVGRKGANAAWLVAQHADLDPAFQKQALDLLRVAVDAGQASPGNLAYLEDRVAVAQGSPQRYGTQVACTKRGAPQPRTPIDDPAGLEARRAAAGLPPYAAYVRKMSQICAGDRSREQ